MHRSPCRQKTDDGQRRGEEFDDFFNIKGTVALMNITKTIDGATLTLCIEGRLDTTTAPDLETLLNASLDNVSELVLDFEHLDYLSSAGLRVLLSAQKRMNKQGSMKLLHVNETVKEVFEITGFADFLTIE